MAPMWGAIVLGTLTAVGAWQDVTYRRLPNALCVTTAIAGFAFVAIESGPAVAVWAVIHAAIALIVGMALFRFGWIGGGDAKFYAACAAWFPLKSGLQLLLMISCAGLILVIGWFGYRQLARSRGAEPAGNFALFPYGLAIGAGALSLKVFGL